MTASREAGFGESRIGPCRVWVRHDQFKTVVAGLDPAIQQAAWMHRILRIDWIAGSGPAMTLLGTRYRVAGVPSRAS
jgi:hypothetical protein